MHEIGLYHPRIHLPSDGWVKAAALYWTKIARVVPEGYTPRDSGTVRALRDELDFVMDISPRPRSLRWTSQTDSTTVFAQFLLRYGQELRNHYGVDRGEVGAAPPIESLATGKIATVVSDALREFGLGSTEGTWTVMHRDLARVYMSALADDLARRNRLCPITDDSDDYAVGTGWTTQRMYDVLLAPHADTDFTVRDPGGNSGSDGQPVPAVVMLAMRTVVPRDIARVPVKRIAKFRERHMAEFGAFRDAVDQAVKQIATDLEGVEDAGIVRTYMVQEVDRRFLVPLRELRRGLRTATTDTASATLTFKYEVPSLANLVAGGLLANQSLLAGGSAAAVGLWGLVRGMRSRRSAILDASPVSYLLLLEQDLAARSALTAVGRRMSRFAGGA
jgi:Family of unknown function (DUF6236)